MLFNKKSSRKSVLYVYFVHLPDLYGDFRIRKPPIIPFVRQEWISADSAKGVLTWRNL